MKIGVNLHSDWGDLRNIRWLRDNTPIRRVRLDFPCKEFFGDSEKCAHIEKILAEAKDFETVMIHVGYLPKYDAEAYGWFNDYIGFVIDLIDRGTLNDKAIIEIWNNPNVSGFWKGDREYMEFRDMLIAIEPAMERAERLGIRIAGFSLTLNHESGWAWLGQFENYLRNISLATVQIYPEKTGQFIELIRRFRSEFPALNFAVAETGHYGTGEEQLCKYRQLAHEIEYATPDNEVFLYHLFDWNFFSKGKGWELINWGDAYSTKPTEKPAVKYLKEGFSFNELEKDLPKDFSCCEKKKWWKKLICWLKGIF